MVLGFQSKTPFDPKDAFKSGCIFSINLPRAVSSSKVCTSDSDDFSIPDVSLTLLHLSFSCFRWIARQQVIPSIPNICTPIDPVNSLKLNALFQFWLLIMLLISG